jgi:hypothetical protein
LATRYKRQQPAAAILWTYFCETTCTFQHLDASVNEQLENHYVWSRPFKWKDENELCVCWIHQFRAGVVVRQLSWFVPGASGRGSKCASSRLVVYFCRDAVLLFSFPASTYDFTLPPRLRASAMASYEITPPYKEQVNASRTKRWFLQRNGQVPTWPPENNIGASV